jgi:hypothetical protein
VLVKPELLDDLVLRPDDFYSPAHGLICAAVMDLLERGDDVDAVSVVSELSRRGLLDAAGGHDELVALTANTVPHLSHAATYLRAVTDAAKLRRLIAVAGEVADIAYSQPEDVAAALGEAERLFGTVDEGASRRALPLVTVADVATEMVRWLWPERLARGMPCLVDGDPDLGKSTVLLDLAARITTGSPMPDGQRLDGPSDVIVASAEDGIATTIRPRLEAAGADLTRVHAVDLAGPDLVVLPDDIPALTTAVERYRAALVIVDPLVAFLASDVNSYRDQDVRRALFPLARMAERTGACVVAVRHFNKTPGGKAIHRGGGSVGIIGMARIAWAIGEHPDDPDRRVLAVSKSNLARKPPSLAYRLVNDPLRKVGRIEWLGAVPVTANQLVALPADSDLEQSSALRGACDFLSEFLDQCSRWVKEVRDESKAAGLAWMTVRRAKDKLEVVAFKVGKPGDSDQGWKWALPGHLEDAHDTPKMLTSRDRASSENLSIFGGDDGDPALTSAAEDDPDVSDPDVSDNTQPELVKQSQSSSESAHSRQKRPVTRVTRKGATPSLLDHEGHPQDEAGRARMNAARAAAREEER